MTDTLFDDFWRASNLDEYTIGAFARQMAAYDADFKTSRLEYPEAAEPLPPVRSSLARIARQRKSERVFSGRPLTKRQIATILSAGQAFNGPEHRSYPAAGALYTVELFQVVFHAEAYEQSILYYDAQAHGVVRLPGQAPVWSEVADKLNISVEGVPQSLVLIVSFPERVVAKYGERGGRFAMLEAGAAMQQLALTVAADSKLKGTAVGGTIDDYWRQVLGLTTTDARIVLGYLVGQ